MAHTKSRILVHMVFATKDRLPLIGPAFRPKLHAYMAGTVRGLGCHLHALDGVEDHCHVVFDLAPKLALADFANKLKASATKWARDEGVREFGWQRGDGAFSVNVDSLDRAVKYVRSQQAHHAKRSFRDELAEFMRVNGMELDAEFVDGLQLPPSPEK